MPKKVTKKSKAKLSKFGKLAKGVARAGLLGASGRAAGKVVRKAARKGLRKKKR